MKKTLPIVIAILALLPAGAALHAEEGESELDAAKRTVREQEFTIQLLELRLRAREGLIRTFFKLQDAQAETLSAARADAHAGIELSKIRIAELLDDLAVEQSRNGLDETELGKQLKREQQRHTRDVEQLVKELTRANETAESNRIQATQALQRVAVVEDRIRHRRDHLAHGVRLLGEIGPAAGIALPWLKKTADLDDEVLVEAAKAATLRIDGGT